MSGRFIDQTKFGGSLDPVDEQGDCLRAAFATLIGVPLEQAFDFNAAYATHDAGGRHWWWQFMDWLRERGWYVIQSPYPLDGLALADVHSFSLKQGDGTPDLHSVVVNGNIVWHDPNPHSRGRDSYTVTEPQYMALVPIDPARVWTEIPAPPSGDERRLTVQTPSVARSSSTPHDGETGQEKP